MVKVGDRVRVVSVGGSGLPVSVIGRELEVTSISSLNAVGPTGKPWVRVDCDGFEHLIRSDQYEELSPVYTLPGPGKYQSIGVVKITLDEVALLYPGKTPSCECGAEKCGQPSHSTWCPKNFSDDDWDGWEHL